MFTADRLNQLPPYLFVEIDRRKREAITAGRDVIDFGVGDPDQPTLPFIIDEMSEAIRRPPHHRYPLGVGSLDFRQSVTEFCQKRFGFSLDPAGEVIALIGSKEGIGHLPLAVLNPGDVALVPEPGYPVYTSGTIFAGATPHFMPLAEQNNWLPKLDEIPNDVRRRARLMFLNYPNNPTGACASREFFEEAVAFAKEYNILLAHDAAYSETYFDQPPPSILEIAGAKETCIELHSFSKTFNMTGWRVGFAIGNRDALAALAKLKNNLDSGVFTAVQDAAIAGLRNVDGKEVRDQIEMYRRRRDVLVEGLQAAGWRVRSPEATFYVWVRCPSGFDSMTTVTQILEKANVVTIPGIGFGKAGEDYIRFALTVSEERTREAVGRIARITW